MLLYSESTQELLNFSVPKFPGSEYRQLWGPSSFSMAWYLTFKEDPKNRIINISSRHILTEVEAVLVEKLGLTKQKAKAAARLLGHQSIVTDPKNVEKICRDPFDDYILVAAVTGKAEYFSYG